MRRWPIAIALALGCGAGSQAPAANAKAPPAGRQEPAVGMRESMRQHFAYATAARDAVISGRLESVRVPLRALATEKPSPEVPNDWLPWLEDMQATAARGAQASSLEEAASAVAALANACGECHRTTHGGQHDARRQAREYDPQDKRGLVEKMARHQYSADALWLGLTGPEHQAWAEGATALMNINVPGLVDEHGKPATTDRPATGEGSLRGSEDPRLPAQDGASEAATPNRSVDLDAALRDLRALGTQADQAKTGPDKQAVFAQIIARCGNCHAKLGIRVP